MNSELTPVTCWTSHTRTMTVINTTIGT